MQKVSSVYFCVHSTCLFQYEVQQLRLTQFRKLQFMKKIPNRITRQFTRGVRKYGYTEISQYFISQYHISILQYCIDFLIKINSQIFIVLMHLNLGRFLPIHSPTIYQTKTRTHCTMKKYPSTSGTSLHF